MLERVVGDRPHALSDCLILEVDAVYPTVDRAAALGSTVHPPVVAGVRREPPTAEPVCRIRQELITAPCAADWRAVLEGRLRLRQRRYTALPPQEAGHRVAVVERHPGARMHVTAELAIGCLAPERKQEVGEAPVGAIRTRRAVARVLRAPGGIGAMVFWRTAGSCVVHEIVHGDLVG